MRYKGGEETREVTRHDELLQGIACSRASDNDRTITGWKRGAGQGRHCHDLRGPFERLAWIKIYDTVDPEYGPLCDPKSSWHGADPTTEPEFIDRRIIDRPCLSGSRGAREISRRCLFARFSSFSSHRLPPPIHARLFIFIVRFRTVGISPDLNFL